VVQAQPRQRPDNVKEPIVVEREFKNLRLVSEQVAEFDYRLDFISTEEHPGWASSGTRIRRSLDQQ
jgi:hypothetical protein